MVPCGQHPGMEHAKVGTGVELCYELRGAPPDPVVVLIAGLGRQLIGWDDAFCDLLVARGFRVLRFDNRDAGLSTHLDGGPAFDIAAARRGGRDAVAYTLDDMADDTVDLLDSLGIEQAHLVGTSMGGMIAQTITIRHPSRVRSLCSIMSTTGAHDVAQPTPEAMAVVTRRPPTDRSGYVDFELTNCRVVGIARRARRRSMAPDAFRALLRPRPRPGRHGASDHGHGGVRGPYGGARGRDRAHTGDPR